MLHNYIAKVNFMQAFIWLEDRTKKRRSNDLHKICLY